MTGCFLSSWSERQDWCLEHLLEPRPGTALSMHELDGYGDDWMQMHRGLSRTAVRGTSIQFTSRMLF
jgi:hypothetical protein